ncbi:MAG: preprotein translocase subunit Sec61beta [Candidatus Nanohaloarchaea archaeon]
MAQEEGGNMPSSMGGLVQYYEADTGIELDPKVVLALGFMVAITGVALNAGVV